MDKGTFYTHALARIGDHNDVEGSDEHIACEAYAQQAVGVCLDYSRWTWATVRATLPLQDKCAELPADCLRLQTVSLPNYEIIGRRIYSARNEKEAVITYTTSHFLDVVSLPDYEPTFCEACILMLASMIAPRLTDNLAIARQLKQEAYSALHRAKVKDARVSDSNDQLPTL